MLHLVRFTHSFSHLADYYMSSKAPKRTFTFTCNRAHKHRICTQAFHRHKYAHVLKSGEQLTECTGKELCRLRKELETDIVRP